MKQTQNKKKQISLVSKKLSNKKLLNPNKKHDFPQHSRVFPVPPLPIKSSEILKLCFWKGHFEEF